MKSLKILASIVGAIVLLPAASRADGFSGNTQTVNQESIVSGHNNVVRSDARQSIVDLYKVDRHGLNTDNRSQSINLKAIVIGNDNTSIQSATQSVIGR